MVHGGAKYSTDNAKCSTQVLNIPRTTSNVLRRCEIFHRQCKMFHGGAKHTTEAVKWSTEPLNIPRTMPNVARRC